MFPKPYGEIVLPSDARAALRVSAVIESDAGMKMFFYKDVADMDVKFPVDAALNNKQLSAFKRKALKFEKRKSRAFFNG